MSVRREVEPPPWSPRAFSLLGGLECPPAIKGLRVLVLEDELDNRELLRAILEECGAEVTPTSTVAEALEKVREVRPQVVVSDIGLPHEDGYGFIQKLRALPKEEGGGIPAVAVTAYARVEDRARLLLAGFQSHVPKPVEPVEPVELLAVLASLRERS